MHFAGSRLQCSNPKRRKNTANKISTKESKKLENSAHFAEDLIKIGAFYKLYYKEILLIIDLPKK